MIAHDVFIRQLGIYPDFELFTHVLKREITTVYYMLLTTAEYFHYDYVHTFLQIDASINDVIYQVYLKLIEYFHVWIFWY
ncbi:hypothetical protein JTB14_032911 [Gonioctena quinquepunctata]|nr:hypothetical protein JTB14_032911 [Gonioctena quinquepunctata]